MVPHKTTPVPMFDPAKRRCLDGHRIDAETIERLGLIDARELSGLQLEQALETHRLAPSTTAEELAEYLVVKFGRKDGPFSDDAQSLPRNRAELQTLIRQTAADVCREFIASGRGGVDEPKPKRAAAKVPVSPAGGGRGLPDPIQ